MSDAEFYHKLINLIPNENFQTVLNARQKALTEMSIVGVTVPTDIKLLGVPVYFALDFDFRTNPPSKPSGDV